MGRPAGSINQIDKAARKILSDAQFAHGIKLQRGQLETLDLMAHGGYRPRNASAVLGALRLKLEWGHSRPKQQHELSGQVTIVVTSPLPGAPGSMRQAKVLDVPREDAQVLTGQRRPITEITSTSEKVENSTNRVTKNVTDTDYVTNDPDPIAEPEEPESPLVHEDGRLRAAPPAPATAEERRAQARAEWQAERAPVAVGDGKADA